MNGRRFLFAVALLGATLFSLIVPDEAQAHRRGFFGGGSNFRAPFRLGIGNGGCYGGAAVRFQNFGYSRSYVAPFAAVSSCYSAPIVSQPIYVAPQPVVYQPPAQFVAPQTVYAQQYAAPLYNTAPATPTCNCVCAPNVYQQPAAPAAPVGGFNPYQPTPAAPAVVPSTQTSYTAFYKRQRESTQSAPRIAKAGYAAFF